MDKDETFLKRLLATFDIEAAEHIAAISTGLVDLEMASAAEESGRDNRSSLPGSP